MQAPAYKRERHFVRTARQTLKALEVQLAADDRNTSEAQTHSIMSALAMIKQAALSVRARAVYRAALQFEEVAVQKQHADRAQALHRLRALVGFYTDGLVEIDPAFARELDLPGPVQAGKQAQLLKPSDENTAHARAQSVIKPLLSLVKSDKTRQALITLADYPGRTRPSPAETETQNIDAVFRQLTNRVLAEARLSGQDVSMSYGATFKTLPNACADRILAVLMATTIAIVRHGLVSLASKRALGLEINATIEKQRLQLSLRWPGQLPRHNAGFVKAIDRFEMTGGSVQMREPRDGQQEMTFFCPLHSEKHIDQMIEIRAGER
ncbi:MAG TPA: Hpt domain-containing protein [Hellea balneolensis]|uniref:Hpt domain-containing protein n=1 Tax=Hellea balneolensis TaxID=287478 RepID=A0A7V5NXJ8_9PROT|nr:Hpt domain-containing protein [Hellea balneolensis]